MAFIWNITFNCADPHRLAAFWAEITGYTEEQSSADRVRLAAPDERGVRHLLFRRSDDPQPSSTVVHIDMATKELPADLAAMIAAGATLVDGGTPEAPVRRGDPDHGWVVVADPEGNRFCIAKADG